MFSQINLTFKPSIILCLMLLVPFFSAAVLLEGLAIEHTPKRLAQLLIILSCGYYQLKYALLALPSSIKAIRVNQKQLVAFHKDDSFVRLKPVHKTLWGTRLIMIRCERQQTSLSKKFFGRPLKTYQTIFISPFNLQGEAPGSVFCQNQDSSVRRLRVLLLHDFFKNTFKETLHVTR